MQKTACIFAHCVISGCLDRKRQGPAMQNMAGFHGVAIMIQFVSADDSA
jgi:hypothetical protein